MSGAVIQICRMAFSGFGIARIFAEPFAHNIASRRVLEKAGFKLEGILKQSVFKNGQLSDSCVYALLRGDIV
jgi:ribosomal-protein-alanine N-acetyltransferase